MILYVYVCFYDVSSNVCIYDRAELYIDVVVAAYNLVQLGLGWYSVEQKTSNPKWFSYLLDQVCITLLI